MASNRTAKDVERRMAELRVVTGTPHEYMTYSMTSAKHVINTGFLHATHSSEYGGWKMVEICSEGGGEADSPLGFPGERVTTRNFYHMLGIAINMAKRARHDTT